MFTSQSFKHFHRAHTSASSFKTLKRLTFGTLFGSLASQSLFTDQKQAKFCGIMGYVGKQNRAFEFVKEGLTILENRGYDSVGVGAIIDGKLEVNKLASKESQGDCLEGLLEDPEINKKYSNLHMAIGHTRWATCGGLEDHNAHPHFDQNNTVSLVHNGTILNHREIKEELVSQGVEFSSETDTEIIAQLIGSLLPKASSKIEAIDQALQQLEGAWALVIIFADQPDTIYCTQNGSHMTIGVGNGEIFIASESRAFQRYTKHVVELTEGEIAEIGKNEEGDFLIKNKEIKKYSSPKKQRLAMGGYKTFFEKEVFEQKEAVYNAIGKSSRISTNGYTANIGGLFEAGSTLDTVQSIYLIGCGSSHIACKYASYFFKSMECFDYVIVQEASDIEEHDLPKKNSLGVFVSQSGETKDVQRILNLYKKRGLPTFGIVNVVGSWIAKETDFGIYMNAGSENSVPSTKSLLASIVCQLLMVLFFNHRRFGTQYQQSRQRLCFTLLALNCFIENMFTPQRKTLGKELALSLKDDTNLLIIAKGVTFPIAQEVALKFKEITYIHAEAIGAGDLKHGPIALIEPSGVTQTKVMIFIMKDDRFEEMCLALDEIKARNAYAIVVSDCLDKVNPDQIDFGVSIPYIDYLSGILALVQLQLSLQELAELKGINPDKPRNLAKCVTVL